MNRQQCHAGGSDVLRKAEGDSLLEILGDLASRSHCLDDRGRTVVEQAPAPMPSPADFQPDNAVPTPSR